MVLIPASFASVITSERASQSVATTTRTSTCLRIRYRICSICSSTSPLAFCTFVSAPSSSAVATKASLSLSQRSRTKVSKLNPMLIALSSSCTSVSVFSSGSVSAAPQPVRNRPAARRTAV